MNVDGQNVRRLTLHPAEDAFPDWSPDGQSIVFVSKWEGNSDIYVINAAGENRRRLTKHPAADWSPAWMSSSFLSVSLTTETRTTLWSTLKQSARTVQ